jgi:hypothetical protein
VRDSEEGLVELDKAIQALGYKDKGDWYRDMKRNTIMKMKRESVNMELKYCTACQSVVQVLDDGTHRKISDEEKKGAAWNKSITELFSKGPHTYINCSECRKKPVGELNLPIY